MAELTRDEGWRVRYSMKRIYLDYYVKGFLFTNLFSLEYIGSELDCCIVFPQLSRLNCFFDNQRKREREREDSAWLKPLVYFEQREFSYGPKSSNREDQISGHGFCLI